MSFRYADGEPMSPVSFGGRKRSTTPLSYPKDHRLVKNHSSLHRYGDDVTEPSGQGAVPSIPASPRSHRPILVSQSLENAATLGNFLQDEAPSGPLAFVESHRFQSIVAFVIIGNAIIIGFETDMEDCPAWFWVEHSLLIFFVFEISCRLLQNGQRFFSGEHAFGNIVDFAIVTSGVIDMWLVPLFEALLRLLTNAKQEHKRNPLLQAIGILRMLRIIRLVRLVKIVQPLYRLAIGVIEAMQGMFWVLVFLGMWMYAIAIICTRLIGKGAALSDDADIDEDLEEIKDMFHSVFSSMFVLFELMSCWSLIPLSPLFKRIPILKLLFVLFYIFAAWALLAVMTGVVSEKMIAVREQINSEEEKGKKDRHLDLGMLNKKFRKADLDDNTMISRNEFNRMLGDVDTMRFLMGTATTLNAQDLHDLFEWLDADKDGTISGKEFVEGFRWMHEQVTPKSFVKFQEKLSIELRALESHLLGFINDRFDRLINAVRAPLKKINAVTSQVQRLDAACSEMAQLLRERGQSRLTREGLAEAERRLSARIDALGEAVETLAELQQAGLVKVLPLGQTAPSPEPRGGAPQASLSGSGFAV